LKVGVLEDLGRQVEQALHLRVVEGLAHHRVRVGQPVELIDQAVERAVDGQRRIPDRLRGGDILRNNRQQFARGCSRVVEVIGEIVELLGELIEPVQGVEQPS
jgi:hypothetical protein